MKTINHFTCASFVDLINQTHSKIDYLYKVKNTESTYKIISASKTIPQLDVAPLTFREITLLAYSFENELSEDYDEAQLISSKLEKMSLCKTINENKKFILTFLIHRIVDCARNWLGGYGWNTTFDLAMKLSLKLTEIENPNALDEEAITPQKENAKTSVLEPHEVTPSKLVYPKSEETKSAPVYSPVTPIKPSSTKSVPTQRGTRIMSSPFMTGKAGDPSSFLATPVKEIYSPSRGKLNFKIALEKYKEDPINCSYQEEKDIDTAKLMIFNSISDYNLDELKQKTSQSLYQLLKDLNNLQKGDPFTVDLSKDLSIQVILDAIKYCKKEIVSDLITYLNKENSFNANLLQKCMEAALKRKPRDIWVLTNLMQIYKQNKLDLSENPKTKVKICSISNSTISSCLYIIFHKTHNELHTIALGKWVANHNEFDLTLFKKFINSFILKIDKHNALEDIQIAKERQAQALNKTPSKWDAPPKRKPSPSWELEDLFLNKINDHPEWKKTLLDESLSDPSTKKIVDYLTTVRQIIF